MRSTMMLLGALLLAAGLITGCGGQKGAGETCTSTGEGAALCESSVCLAVDCTGETRHVCGGAVCTLAEGCNDGQVCVSTAEGGTYCLPNNVCGSNK